LRLASFERGLMALHPTTTTPTPVRNALHLKNEWKWLIAKLAQELED
jgi:hypothetical protein